ncbi:Trm112 family protein, partial [bacterium]|nr:Trm112 family protein [bacterium]
PKLLEILACPVCGAPLQLDGDRLVCTSAHVAFPVEDGVPILLPDQAKPPHPVGAPQADEQTA